MALEIQEKNKDTFHFHLFLDMPFVKTATINNAWISASNQSHTKNAVRDIKTVKNKLALIHYYSNYLQKKGSKSHEKRKFSYSRGVMGGEYARITLENARELFTYYEEEPVLPYNVKQYDWVTHGNFTLCEKFFSKFNEALTYQNFNNG